MQDANTLVGLLNAQAVVVLDGGLATELEARGCNLDDDLWSARVLLDTPQTIAEVHLDYLRAGADVITTATYQATIAGLARRGLGEREACDVFLRAVSLAVRARERFWRDGKNRRGRVRPLVAASIGPYGAFLADGSEYTGQYDVDDAGLRVFHEKRWRVLAASDADLLACETIPSRDEARVLLRLLKETPRAGAWMSFSCRDGQHLRDGTPIADVARECDAIAEVAAIGVNCTAPQYVASLISEMRRATQKPILVYPNSGETYDATRGAWSGSPRMSGWDDAVVEWVRLGATAIGGCCRVGPRDIVAIRRAIPIDDTSDA